ncbi:hypothetical protein HU200_064026 [Digitaria exilis]|uniref:RNase H type-1 domain-containing protein n=1 Tax=Digitaria exilis TaxID=1010633 RepID=A0A835A2R4_9POAL|nr:hypothetical protein HU200_064026 [Digitaria exilis]
MPNTWIGQEVVKTLLSMDDHKRVNSVMLMWAWWDARNKANAGEGSPEIDEVLRRATLMTVDAEVLSPQQTCKLQKRKAKWKPPKPDILKVNVDGAYLQSEKVGGWGYNVRTSDGDAVLAGAGRLPAVHDALCAEMHACLRALEACSDQGMARVEVESDCAVLVSALSSSSYDLSTAGVLFQEARLFISLNFESVVFKFCPRSSNGCAHELARYGLSRDPDQDCVWLDPLPEFVSNLVARDLAESVVNE